MEKNSKKCQNLTKNSQNFDQKIEIRKRCKGVHCVDLGESFPTSIYLQKSASIQPRTSPSKFGEKFNSLFTSLLSLELASISCKLILFSYIALLPCVMRSSKYDTPSRSHKNMLLGYFVQFVRCPLGPQSLLQA